MDDRSHFKIAILWRGDREAREAATPQNNRYHRVFEELAALGVMAAPAVFDEDFADEVRDQLLAVDGVLVWVDPLSGGKTRHVLDPLLREVSARGPFMARCEAYFGARGCIIDQPFQPRLPEGMIRCYMGADKVVGFGHQLVKALIPPPPEGPDSPAAQPGLRIMHGADAAPFQALRAKMETEWTPQMMEVLGIDRRSLPIIWDADFLYGPHTASGEDSYVLCEINVSSCFA